MYFYIKDDDFFGFEFFCQKCFYFLNVVLFDFVVGFYVFIIELVIQGLFCYFEVIFVEVECCYFVFNVGDGDIGWDMDVIS